MLAGARRALYLNEMRTRSVVAPLWLSLALLLQFSDSAKAGPVEQLAQVALHPTDSKVIVLRYRDGGDGFFYSRDSGESWQLMCLSAIDIEVPRSGPIAVAGDGHVMMGVFQGLYIDDGKGCGWTKNDFVGDVWVSDVVAHPSDPAVMFAATSKGGMGVLNGLVKRDADGEFSNVGEKEELLITQLRVVDREGGGLRFYESVLKGTIKVMVNGMEVDGPNYLVRYSDDEAETFTEFPFGATDGNLRLQAIDPSNPDRVVAVLNREGKDDDVLVSDDRGATFRLYMKMSQFGAIQFLPSGKVFLGEAGISTLPSAATGLWVAESLDEDPVKIGEYPAQCLAYQESTDTLFACQYRTFGKVDQQSGEYTQLFAFNDVKDFVDCPDLADSCERQLCQDYCGIGHFATAPVCNVYTNAGLCGPCAAMVDNGADAAMCTATGSAGSSAAGRGGAGGTSSGAAGTTATAGTTAPPRADAGMPSGGASGKDGDDGGSGGDDGDDGLCGCSSVGASRNGALPVAFSALMALAFTLRRRTSRRR